MTKPISRLGTNDQFILKFSIRVQKFFRKTT